MKLTITKEAVNSKKYAVNFPVEKRVRFSTEKQAIRYAKELSKTHPRFVNFKVINLISHD